MKSFLKYLSEDINQTFAYHCTQANPNDIIKSGFHTNTANGFTEDNQFEILYDRYLPVNPCFISRIDIPVWDLNSKYCLKLDITNLDLYPDFGHLIDLGAYYEDEDDDEVLFWWDDRDLKNPNPRLRNCPKLLEYLKQHKGYLHSYDFAEMDSLEMIGTACIAGEDVTKERIVEVKSKSNINEAKKITGFGGTCGIWALNQAKKFLRNKKLVQIVFCTDIPFENKDELLNSDGDLYHVAIMLDNDVNQLYDSSGKITVEYLKNFCKEEYRNPEPNIWALEYRGTNDKDDLWIEKVIRNCTSWSDD